MVRAPVHLNVYDMYWLNDYASSIGFGVYHSGVEVYGIEYAYGGHPFSLSGIFENTPQDAEELGENFKFRESIPLGETDFTSSDVRRLIELLGRDFRGDKYHLISKNCNHFTSTLAKALTGQDIPPWVNRLAFLSGSIPFLERCLPQEWLTPVALQNSIDERKKSGEILLDAVEKGEEATEDMQFSSKANTIGSRISQVMKARNGLTNAVFDAASSAPTSARTSSPVRPLTRIWNSIKNLTFDS